MNNLCNNCGAPSDIDKKTCDYCGEIFNKQSNDKIDIEVCLIADTAYNADNFDQAIIYYNKILEQNKNNANAWLRKGRCKLLIGEKSVFKFNPNSVEKLSEGLLCLGNAIKFSNSRKVQEKVVAVLSNFISFNSSTITNANIIMIVSQINSLKKIKEEEKIALAYASIICFEKNMLEIQQKELDFFIDFNQGVVNPALEIKRKKVINKYNSIVDLIIEFESENGFDNIKNKYYDFNSKDKKSFILSKIEN